MAVAEMIKITDGVEFNTIAREWRMKWSVCLVFCPYLVSSPFLISFVFLVRSADNDKKSLAAVQQTLDVFLPQIKKVDGVKSIQRIVCGGCLDYKVIVALPAEKWGAWEQAKFAPEEEFLAALKAINGVSTLETQTYTIMPVL